MLILWGTSYTLYNNFQTKSRIEKYILPKEKSQNKSALVLESRQIWRYLGGYYLGEALLF